MFKRIAASCAVVFAAVLLLVGPNGQAAPGIAEDDIPTFYNDCPLERIGNQLVRCDNLTGAGAQAPFWIPEQSS